MRTDAECDLAAPESWRGGFYEAAMVLGPRADDCADARLRTAISAVWSIPWMQLRGREHTAIATASLENIDGLRGWMRHEAFGPAPLTTIAVREEPGDRNPDGGKDWLYASVPLGGLTEPMGWPFGNLQQSRRWREPLERALAEIALEVSRNVPFWLAAIGFEISGIVDSQALRSERRWVGYVAPIDGKYTYLPTTCWD